MLKKTSIFNLGNDIAAYFRRAALPSQQETLGAIVIEILYSGQTLSRRRICLHLLTRLEKAYLPQDRQHLLDLIRLLFSQ
ncbi:regulatory protein YcgZ [Pantoea stewartii]|uniref:regulatory protein YcgZ n=1 Tax=Pantoea stewartii TaxID=66269 RepID=UPI0016290A5F|nr:regulatory protein YcgZ [Pantoea stewartii]MBC0854856.1 two-component-system connector protein YcgZ [Pantoea stewartii]